MAKLRIAGVGAGYFSRFQTSKAGATSPDAECVGIVRPRRGKARRRWPTRSAFRACYTDARGDARRAAARPRRHRHAAADARTAALRSRSARRASPHLPEAVGARLRGRRRDRRARRARGRAAASCTRTSASSRGTAKRSGCSTPACWARCTRVAFRLRPGDGQGPRAYLDRQPYFQTMPRLLVVETAIHWIDTFRFLMGEVDGRSRAAAPR